MDCKRTNSFAVSIASLSINLIIRRTVYRQLVDSRHVPLTKATCVSFELYIRENPGNQVQICFVVSLNALSNASCLIISFKNLFSLHVLY